jgi:deazaflavin-dependent oxidoreductase (nitroreductase family)
MIPTASNEAAAAPPWTHLAVYEVNGEIHARLHELHETREALGLKTDEWFTRVPLAGIDAYAVTTRVDSTRWKREDSPEWTATKSKQKTENERVVEEFRDNKGRVESYQFPVVLLHNKGAKSGLDRINPLACLPLDRDLAIFATSGGSPRPPDWYYNILANPRTTVEFGTETYEVVARVTSGEERKQIWLKQLAEFPHFGHMDEVTTREIPVVLLERV